MVGLIDHLEQTLGEIQAGWNSTPDGLALPFQVARFAGEAHESVPYATAGLSRHSVKSPASGRSVRQELLLVGPQVDGQDVLASILVGLAKSVIDHQVPILRGDVIGPSGPLLPGASVSALYATVPVYYPEEFASYQGSTGPVVIVWLVPITSSEATYARNHGWQALEDQLVSQDPDLLDFRRQDMALPTS